MEPEIGFEMTSKFLPALKMDLKNAMAGLP
jgi:hypothetical protein